MAFYVAVALLICINGIVFIMGHLVFNICLGLFLSFFPSWKRRSPVFVNISHALDELRRFGLGIKCIRL